jgi:hypothetical protein
MNLSESILNHIFDYLYITDKVFINKYWYNKYLLNKNHIVIWYKKYTIQLNTHSLLEYVNCISEKRMQYIYILRYPDEYKLDMINLAHRKLNKNVDIYLNEYIVTHSIKKAWKLFINDCNKNELMHLGW